MTRMEHGPNVTVEVLNAQSGAPEAGVPVTVTPAVYWDTEMTQTISVLTSGGDGAIRFYAPPGIYTFSAPTPAAPIEPVEVLGAGWGVGIVDGGSP